MTKNDESVYKFENPISLLFLQKYLLLYAFSSYFFI